ncbi:MAG: beta-lactamase family protein [Caulobacter sp.]|nr:beta-lactamase family protein [Caulobacter sp.]
MIRRRLIAGLAALPMLGAARARPPPSDLDAVWRQAVADPRQGRTDALLVIRDGETRLERYGPGHGPDVRHVSWSMAKAVTHALVGAAVLHDHLDIDRPVGVIPGDHRVTLRHLLTLTDGLPWDEARRPLAVASDASRLLFGEGRLDVARFAASRPGPRRTPGTHWNYSTGAYHLAAAELTARLFPGRKAPDARRAAMAAWMRRRLFAPAGMDSALFEFDPAGTFYAGSLMWATARDFARLASLYLHDGLHQGVRILPPGWARFAATPTVEPSYGAGWWLEGRPGSGAGPTLLGGQPPDAFHARGLDGQVAMVVPSRRLVIVRLGYTPDAVTGWPAIGGCLRRIITVVS